MILNRLAIAILLAVVLPIHGQQNSSQPGGNEEAGQDTQWTVPCTVEKDATTPKCDWSQAKPDSYFKRLFSPENAPNIALAVIGFAGILAAFLTLRKVNGQLAEMKRQANAMEETPKRQLRAYLCVETACVKIRENTIINGQLGTWLEGQLYIKNGGQTPAYDVRTWVHGSIRPYPESTPVPGPPDGLPKGIAIVPAQGQPSPLCAKQIAITPQAMKSLKSPDTAYYVQAEVHYRDIFKDWHCLKVRMFFGAAAGTRTREDANGAILGFLVPDSWGNSEEDESDPDSPQNPN